MSIENTKATAEEFVEYIGKFPRIDELEHGLERAFAIAAGWKDDKYEYLYRKYIKSTHEPIGKGGQTGKAKGDALEDLVRYFLKCGGIVKKIKDINAVGKWQVDGQGLINISNLEVFFSKKQIAQIGFQLYLECKNHSEPMSKTDFSDHCSKMEDNNCNVGVAASTSGFKISAGKGIAEKVYVHTYKDNFHLLLAIRDFDLAYSENIPPIAIVLESFERATNDLYRNDQTVQNQYTKQYCHKLAQDRYDEMFKFDIRN